MKFLSRHAVTSLALVSFMTTFNVCQAERYRSRKAFSNDKWGYIERKFKTEVDDCNHKYLQNTFKYSLAIVGAGVGGLSGIFVPLPSLFDQDKGFIEFFLYYLERFFVRGVTTSLGSVVGFVIPYKIAKRIKKRIKHDVAFHVLKEFLNEWPNNKPYTPKELHKTFEQLKKKYKARGDRGDEWLREVSYTVVKKIRNEHILG